MATRYHTVQHSFNSKRFSPHVSYTHCFIAHRSCEMPDDEPFIVSDVPVNCQLRFSGNLKNNTYSSFKLSKIYYILLFRKPLGCEVLKVIKEMCTLYTIILLFKYLVSLKVPVNSSKCLFIISKERKKGVWPKKSNHTISKHMKNIVGILFSCLPWPRLLT